MCPENSTVSVETGQCGQIRFASLPGGSPLRTTDEYNPGGLSLWYNLASGVIDAAIPGGLPYGEKWILHVIISCRYTAYLVKSI